MKSASANLKATLAGTVAPLAIGWLIRRTDREIFAFTDHDLDFDFDLESVVADFGYTAPIGIDGTGTQTYRSTTGYQATDIESTAALAVDNLEVHGLLVSPSITEDDLRAGRWDYADVVIFMVNWNELTEGALIERVGKLGQVTVDAGIFKAELRGMTQAYSRTIGELTSPSCRADLGDARCKVDLVGGSPSFTVTGTIDSTDAEGLVLLASDRAEAGPATGIEITGITNADPAVVTLSSAVPFAPGQPVTLSGIIGPTALNTTVVVSNPVGNSFDIGIDTSDVTVYPAYAGGGVAKPYGGGSGYFDGGKITITSGANADLSREVKSYVPGEITLQLPFPYPVEAHAAYSMHAGCDKSMDTCRYRFNNLINMRAEPYLPGMDRLVQVGRHAE